MREFTDRADLSLTDITFPASHDAGLSEANDCYHPYGKLSSREDTVCHYHDINGQLNVGSRAFDLRIDLHGGTLRTFHGEGPVGSVGGGWGQSAASIFRQIDTFLRDHPGEIVIIRISHTKEKHNVHRQIEDIIDDNRMYRCGPRNLAVEPLDKLRGKAIAIFDEGALARTDPMRGFHRLMKYSSDGMNVGLPICGKYAGQQANLREMAQQAVVSGNEHRTHRQNIAKQHEHLFMVYWQLAMKVKSKTTTGQDVRNAGLTKLDDNQGTHYNLDYLLNVHRGGLNPHHVTVNPVLGRKTKVNTIVTPRNRMKTRPNYLNLDFVNEIACGKIIEFNKEFLPPRPG